MKMKNVLLATMMVGALIIGSAQAAINFTVDSGAAQFGWINHELIAGGDPGGFGYDPALNTSAFVGSTQILGPNTDIYTANNGGLPGEDGYWFTGDESGTQIRTIEANAYQELPGIAMGETVNFDYSVVSSSLTGNGYDAVAFIKVLDPNAGWATTQIVTADLAVLGANSLTLDTLAGGVVVQAGFAVTGLYVDPTTAAGLGTIEIIPEPATFGLLGIAGLGMFIARRRFSM